MAYRLMLNWKGGDNYVGVYSTLAETKYAEKKFKKTSFYKTAIKKYPGIRLVIRSGGI